MACVTEEVLNCYGKVDSVPRMPFEEAVVESGIAGDSGHIVSKFLGILEV